jgi:hypothetical protein
VDGAITAAREDSVGTFAYSFCGQSSGCVTAGRFDAVGDNALTLQRSNHRRDEGREIAPRTCPWIDN